MGVPISDEQRALIDRLSCTRLASDKLQNSGAVLSFASSRAGGVLKTFKKHGIERDEKGVEAWYLVKFPDGAPAAFFSLKCALLHEGLIEERIASIGELLLKERKSGRTVLSDDDKLAMIDDCITSTEERVNAREVGSHNARAKATHPAVELSNFCVDDNAKSRWLIISDGQHTLGEVVFWQYIVPIVCGITQGEGGIGCEFLCLFAADDSKSGSLINYYSRLKFDMPGDIGTTKPEYDFFCTFMSQKLSDMRSNRELFFDNFNCERIDVLDEALSSVPVLKEHTELLLYLTHSNGADATARKTDKGFYVLSGSTIAGLDKTVSTVESGANRAIGKLRAESFSNKTVVDGKLTMDMLFASASAAAMFVTGSKVSGTEVWKDKDGTSLKDILARKEDDAS